MMSPLHTSGAYAAFRAQPSAPHTAKSADVAEDGDKGAAAPVAAAQTKEGAKEPTRSAKSGDKKLADGKSDGMRTKGSDGEPLDDADLKQVEQLKHRDREVRNHEMAHVAAGGQYVNGGPTYSYQTGPDGKRYAVGGEVSISTGKESSPQKSIAKAKVIRRAALAPGQHSAQDRSVAAAAAKMEQGARTELRQEKVEETKKVREDSEDKADEARESQEAAKGDAPRPELLGEADDPQATTQAAGGPKGLAPRPSHIPAAYSAASAGPSGAGASAGGGGGGGLLNLIA